MEANTPRQHRLAKVAAQRHAGLTLVLEDIHDPHNAAAIFRTCDALGVQHVHLVFQQEAPWNPKRVGRSSSSSANKWLDFTVHAASTDALDHLRTEGYFQVGTALTDTALCLFDAPLSQDRLAIWVGNEHRGLSQAAIGGVDQVIKIPMSGFVQSLNVSVSAAIVLYETVRQRRRTGRTYTYSQAAQRTLMQSFKARA